MSKIKKYITQLDVQFISLVKKGANKRTLIYKSAGLTDGEPAHEHPVRILKLDDEKQLIYCTVYAPDEADAHEEGMTAVEIEKAAHAFLAAGRTSQVDKQHDEVGDEGHVVESFILKGADERFPGEKEGAWVVAIKVTDEETWAEVKKAEITGVSIGGTCVKVTAPDAVAKSSFLERIRKSVANLFKARTEQAAEDKEPVNKDFNERLKLDALKRAVWALNDELANVIWDDKKADKKAAITEAIGQFLAYINDLETDVIKTIGGPMPDEKTAAAPEPNAELEALKKTVEQLSSENKELKSRLEKVEKAAPGRQSEEGRTTETQKQDRKGLPIF